MACDIFPLVAHSDPRSAAFVLDAVGGAKSFCGLAETLFATSYFVTIGKLVVRTFNATF